MNRKKDSKWLRLFAVVAMSFCIISTPFLVTGCVTAGGDFDEDFDDDWSDEEKDDFLDENSGGIEIDAIKVLRRPDDYDFSSSAYYFDEASKEFVVNENYYGSFAENIFQALFDVYGVVNASNSAGEKTIFENLLQASPQNNNLSKIDSWFGDGKNIGDEGDDGNEISEEIKYFYDAIRYQIVEENERVDDKGTPETADDVNLVDVVADADYAWNWLNGFDALNCDEDGVKTYLNSGTDAQSSVINNNEIENTYLKEDFSQKNIKTYYENLTDFKTTFMNEDLIDMLEFATYSIVLGIDVADGSWESGVWQVDGYPAENGYVSDDATPDKKSSMDMALESIKKTFDKHGSYVGLTQDDCDEITKYVMNEIIGEKALQNSSVQDLFFEDVVPAVVEFSAVQVVIGGRVDDQGNLIEITTLKDGIVASEVKDFIGSTFFLSTEDDPFSHIESQEYQSMLIIPSDKVNLTDVWFDFKYDAKDENGHIINEDNLPIEGRQSITIYVSIRYFNGEESKMMTKKIEVINGHVAHDSINTTLEFELYKDMFGNKVEDGFLASVDTFEDPFPVKNMPDVQDRTSKITGKNPNHSNYQIEQAKDPETKLTMPGGMGIINPEKFVKDDEDKTIPYVEVLFNVDKTDENGNYDFDKNFDFQVAITQFYNEDFSKYEGIV